MEKEGGIAKKVYIRLTGLIFIFDIVSLLVGSADIRNMAIVGLILITVVALGIKCVQLIVLRRQNNDRKRWLNKRQRRVKRALLDVTLTAEEHKYLQEDECFLLDEEERLEEWYEEGKSKLIKKSVEMLVTSLIVVILILIIEPVYTYAKELVNVIFNGSGENSEDSTDQDETKYDIEENEEDDFKGEDAGNAMEYVEAPVHPIGNEAIIAGMTFYLDDFTLAWIPTPEMEAAVFYVDHDSLDINGIVTSHVEYCLNLNLEDTYNGHTTPKEESLAMGASAREDTFDDSREKVKEYAAENKYEEWKDELMHSSYLDDIISDRLEIWDAGKQNSTMASLLANNYQDYALEYQNQGGDGYTILSYYMESIIWSERALSYEDADKKEIFKYIKGRYWDIVTCFDIPEKYRNEAEAIYMEMGKYEDYIEVEIND